MRYILKIMPQVSLFFALFSHIIIKYSSENILKYCIINDLLFLEYIKIEENQKEMKKNLFNVFQYFYPSIALMISHYEEK